MQSLELLVSKVRQRQLDLITSPHPARDIEAHACDLYIKIFEICLKKCKRGKHEKYIQDEFKRADSRRLDFATDGQVEDAHVESIKQEAYRQVWEALGLPAGILVKVKSKPIWYPMDVTNYKGRYG